MDDKDREIIKEVLHAAGTAGQEGFAAMVKYQWADGFTDLLGSLVALVLLLILVVTAFKWKIEDEEGRITLRMTSAILGAILFAIIFEAGIMGAAQKMIAPEGAAIASVLHR